MPGASQVTGNAQPKNNPLGIAAHPVRSRQSSHRPHREVGYRRDISILEDVAPTLDPALTEEQAVRAAPSLSGLVAVAVVNSDNWPIFAFKAFHIVDTLTVDASQQARDEIDPTE